MKFKMVDLGRYLSLTRAGRGADSRHVNCSWCGRSVSHNRGDYDVCIGDDALPYCGECAGASGGFIDKEDAV